MLLRERRAPRNPSAPEEWTIHNALFEAHTVHARVLYLFLFQERRQPDDAVASDYVPDWSSHRPEKMAALNSLAFRVGKEIAHLTYGRLVYKSDEERQWAFTDITRALIDVLNIWLARAPQYVRDELGQYLRDYAVQPELSHLKRGPDGS